MGVVRIVVFSLLLTINALEICEHDGENDCICIHKGSTVDCVKAFIMIHDNDNYLAPLRTANLILARASEPPQVAYFQNNDIYQLESDEILPGNEKALEVLDFSNNRIERIGKKAFEKMENLKILKLSHNNLQNLSSESFVGGPNWNLRELYLNDNPLVNIENIFTEMPFLEKLVLDQVTDLDLQKAFSGYALRHLRYLSLERCNLTSLPDDIFLDMPNLQYLSLSGNPLTEVPQAIQFIPTLEVLKLSSTPITEIPAGAFLYDSNLIELYLADNKYLRTIRSGAFHGLRSLKQLTLKGCSSLRQIHNEALEDGKTPLTKLDVESANLTTLPSSLRLDSIETLMLGGNPWNCTCWVGKVNSKHIDLGRGSLFPRCKKPASLDGKMLNFVRTSEVCTVWEVKSSYNFSIFSYLFIFLPFVIAYLVFIAIMNSASRFYTPIYHRVDKHTPPPTYI